MWILPDLPEGATFWEVWKVQSFQEAKQSVITNFEKRYLSNLLAESGGNVTLAASRARKERRAFGKLLKKHGLERKLVSEGQQIPATSA